MATRIQNRRRVPRPPNNRIGGSVRHHICSDLSASPKTGTQSRASAAFHWGDSGVAGTLYERSAPGVNRPSSDVPNSAGREAWGAHRGFRRPRISENSDPSPSAAGSLFGPPEQFQIVKRLRESARVLDVQNMASLVVFEKSIPDRGNLVDSPFECQPLVFRGATLHHFLLRP